MQFSQSRIRLLTRHLPRCRIAPDSDAQFDFQVGDRTVTKWHFGRDYPGPFFYPILGPSGKSLTRMGHPGAPNHDHHRSVWFAHEKLLGANFWSYGSPARIVQTQWYAIDERDDFARIGFELQWLDGHDPKPLIAHDLIVTLRPHSNQIADGWSLELQSNFTTKAEGVEFLQSNFGILGVRMAKSISAHFGAGVLTGENGLQGEPALFGQPNRWMDYSGPIHLAPTGIEVVEGITLIHHKDNSNTPCKWHVRSDGWMGPSLSRDAAVAVPTTNPLVVRYLLDIHPAGHDAERTRAIADRFDASPAWTVKKSTQPHRQYEFAPLA